MQSKGLSRVFSNTTVQKHQFFGAQLSSQCGVSSISDSSLFQLILLLKVCRPLQCLVNANYRFLICCTCHFQSDSFFFVYFGFLCKSLQCLIFALTQRREDGYLFRFTCSVVLWGGRNTVNKYHWHVWGVLAVHGPHWVCPSSWCVCFPGLHCSGSRLLFRGTVQSQPWVLCTSQV